MAYSDRVSVLCEELGIENPIREEDLDIASLTFQDGHLQTILTVESTDMNRAGRLFLEWQARHDERLLMKRNRLFFAPHLKSIAQLYFGELWQDTSEMHRTLIHGIKVANCVWIKWKERNDR